MAISYMHCYVHPDREAVATCTSCGRAVCDQCSIEVSGKIVCRNCISEGRVPSSVSLVSTSTTNPLAAASLILGILGLCAFCPGGFIGSLLFEIPAAATGYIARRQILEKGEGDQGLPLATAGMILGVTAIVLSVAIFILIGGVAGLALIADLFSR